MVGKLMPLQRRPSHPEPFSRRSTRHTRHTSAAVLMPRAGLQNKNIIKKGEDMNYIKIFFNGLIKENPVPMLCASSAITRVSLGNSSIQATTSFFTRDA